MRSFFEKVYRRMYVKNKLRLEKEFKNNGRSVKFLLMRKKSNKLLVVFSGFAPKEKTATYNYIWKFKNIKCNKLYILDDFGYELRGAYYLGENGDNSISDAVTQLISSIQKKNLITNNNIITVGSSKGGFASLYFTFKNGYGTVISGGPQILVGDFLNHEDRLPFIKFISGGTSTKDINYLNNILLDTIAASREKPKIYLHVGKEEVNDMNHINTLIKKLEYENIESYSVDYADYSNHKEIGKYFPDYANLKINNEL